MTPAERLQHARQQEEALIQRETELADSTADPKTPDDFDRILLGQPNSSELWAKYIAYHVAVCSYNITS